MKTIVWFGFLLGALSAEGEVIVSNPGQGITLNCGDNIATTKVEWRHGNELIINTNGMIPRKGQTDIVKRTRVKVSDLEISRVKEEDAGEFTCIVGGKSHEHTLLVVSVSVSPSYDFTLGSKATLHCQVKGLNPDPTVQWKRPDGSPQTGSQTVQLISVARSDAGTWECTFSHKGVRYSENVNITVQEPTPTTPPPDHSQNSKDGQKCNSCTTSRPSDGTLLLGLSWWMWVVIGVGCLVVVLLMVLVICLCKKIKRRKRKLQKMKNSRQPLTQKQYCQCNRPTAAAKPQQRRWREKPSAHPLQPLLLE